jgi:hypothetical protein
MVIDDFREYGGLTDEELIDDVFDEFVAPFDDPYDIDYATFVTAVPHAFDIITFDSITVRQFMDTLCGITGAVWYVDYSRKLHYAADEADLVPPWHLSDNPDGATSFRYFDDITKEKDATNLVNMVFVVCATDLLPVSLWFIDQGSIDKYGPHRAIVRDTSLFDIDDIEDKGNSILEKFKDPIVTYVLKTYKGTPGGDDGIAPATPIIRAGQHIRVVCAFYDLDDTFLINNLVITFSVDGTPVYEITCGGLDSSASGSATRSNLDQIHVPNITPSSLPIAARGWGHDMTFSSTDYRTVAWEGPGAGDGTITTADGQEFSIAPANTGDMADVTYIYLDTGLSLIALQHSVNAVDSIGLGKILIAVCAPSGIPGPDPPEVLAMYQVFGGGEGTTLFLHADNIAGNCITANEMYVNQLSAIVADMGVLTAGEIKMYAGVWDVNATGFRLVVGEIAGQNAGVDQFRLDAATGRITAVNATISGTITIGNPGDIDGSAINNDEGWTDDTTADAANAHRLLGVTGTWARTDADTITWTGVVLRLGDGSNVNILNGNTGNMAAKTYIYYDGTTTLKITANPNVIGGTHTLVAVAQNGATLANIQIVGGGTYISGDWINTGTITAAKMNVGTLSAITANMGTLTAGTIQTAAAGNDRVIINIADGIRGIDAADVVQFQLDPADGKAYAGAGDVVLDADGISIITGVANRNKITFTDIGVVRAEFYGDITAGHATAAIVGGPCRDQGDFGSVSLRAAPAVGHGYNITSMQLISEMLGAEGRITHYVDGDLEGNWKPGRLEIIHDLRIREGLVIGSTLINPAAGLIYFDGPHTDGTHSWELGGQFILGAPTANGYVQVWIGGALYKLLAES